MKHLKILVIGIAAFSGIPFKVFRL